MLKARKSHIALQLHFLTFKDQCKLLYGLTPVLGWHLMALEWCCFLLHQIHQVYYYSSRSAFAPGGFINRPFAESDLCWHESTCSPVIDFFLSHFENWRWSMVHDKHCRPICDMEESYITDDWWSLWCR